jgi:hypothetical protein
MQNTLKSFTDLASGKLKLWKVMFFAIHGAVESSWRLKVCEKVGVWSPKKIDPSISERATKYNDAY